MACPLCLALISLPLISAPCFAALPCPVPCPALQLSDHTGETWVTAFQEQGLEIMGGRTGEAAEAAEAAATVKGAGGWGRHTGCLHKDCP
jgi:hypothetical protein